MRHRLHGDAGERAGDRRAGSLRPGQHLNLLGADGPGKAEATVEAIARVPAEGRLFCDEWDQARHGGELTGRRSRRGSCGPAEDVTELGAVCAGLAPGRATGRTARSGAVRLDRGSAIQDLAIRDGSRGRGAAVSSRGCRSERRLGRDRNPGSLRRLDRVAGGRSAGGRGDRGRGRKRHPTVGRPPTCFGRHPSSSCAEQVRDKLVIERHRPGVTRRERESRITPSSVSRNSLRSIPPP